MPMTQNQYQMDEEEEKTEKINIRNKRLLLLWRTPDGVVVSCCHLLADNAKSLQQTKASPGKMTS